MALNKLLYGISFMNNMLLACMHGYIKKKSQGFYDKQACQDYPTKNEHFVGNILEQVF